MEKVAEYKYMILVGVVAFALGFGVSSLIGSRSEGSKAGDDRVTPSDTSDMENLPPLPFSNKPTDSSRDASKTMGSVLVGDNAIAVDEQSAGDVVVSMVTLAEPAWVVIHEDRNGAPGNILGAGWFPAGDNRNVSMTLLRKTEPGKVYYAMIHADAGADKKFAKESDMPIKDPSGAVLMMKFSTR
ncbi:MAG: hypothetical protein A3C84_03695 [Candidatus Ryanbacteria bacterium RIFCSPHIGHO2_02_FULL_48_12]|uniref:DUF7282 domain-containing protein n=1 Tax=Candidatus Ryanbacteria bacterium RIFCSPHIGHO2_01_FULL_48_27 TaxID=1802115 RepID=A0A1G2G6P3_9BACT|nr:MAG: hypothetical protein A2756_03065 [Candidatus Ryanbacteria bacterium RIFCSPHIGHO2_01_FULL_48_27]OGZ49444.1 MAG: hypothetical protein A3C84_03695 [Candidatus Ryanbacteria bacterium RIFCSPHIGHO2_02_FULL_48_12]